MACALDAPQPSPDDIGHLCVNGRGLLIVLSSGSCARREDERLEWCPIGLLLGGKDRIAIFFFFFFQAEDGIRDLIVTGVQTCALPISACRARREWRRTESRKASPCSKIRNVWQHSNSPTR